MTLPVSSTIQSLRSEADGRPIAPVLMSGLNCRSVPVMLDFAAFSEDRAFGPEVTSVMGEAYEAIMRELPETGQPALVREVFAKRIIDIVTSGERDPKQIARRALIELCVIPKD
jgi:hypothetical protein